jgi:hypothetical protein
MVDPIGMSHPKVTTTPTISEFLSSYKFLASVFVFVCLLYSGNWEVRLLS